MLHLGARGTLQAPGAGSLSSQLDTTLHPGFPGTAQLQGPRSPRLQPQAPATQLGVGATAWEVPVLHPGPRWGSTILAALQLSLHSKGSPEGLEELQLSRHWMAVSLSAMGGKGGSSSYGGETHCYIHGHPGWVQGYHWVPYTLGRGEGQDTLWFPDTRCLAGGSREPQRRSLSIHPEKPHIYYGLSCCGAAPPPHPNLPNRPGTPCNTITPQVKPDSHFTATTEPGLGASRPHPPSHILSNVGGKGVPSRAMSHPRLGPGDGQQS